MKEFEYLPWKIEFCNEGKSTIISYPKNQNGKIRDVWIFGPLDNDIARFIIDAVKAKQSNRPTKSKKL